MMKFKLSLSEIKLIYRVSLYLSKKYTTLLFSIIADPFEEVNLAPEQPHLVDFMTKRLDHYKASMIEPHIADQVVRGNPNKFGGIWSTGWCSPLNDKVQIVVV